jgi:phosphoribosylamine--glycine ligase
VLCFHAGTRAAPGGVESAGGRVATFVGLGDELAVAREAAYAAIAAADLDGGQYRTDIAQCEVGA